MDKRLIRLEVENFRSLRKVVLPLGDLTVLVGPNGAGKTNVLKVFEFLADIIQTDLEPALDQRGGFDHVVFHGGDSDPASIVVKVVGTWTTYSSPTAPDEYDLRITRARRRDGSDRLSRRERFQFKRSKGRGRRITVSGQRATIADSAPADGEQPSIGIRPLSSGLTTFSRLLGTGGEEVTTFADRLASFRVFEVSVSQARLPTRELGRSGRLADDASNLSAFLLRLRSHKPDVWRNLEEDARHVLPQLAGIDFEYPAVGAREVVIVLQEHGLRRPTQLADASYGTIRLLGFLALLYDPDPPALTCVEEIDHGLHPQALELLVERLRDASRHSQFIIATHSPAFVDRLRPDEFVVCERSDDGSSVIPAISSTDVARIVDASEGLPLGELWFSGALGGNL